MAITIKDFPLQIPIRYKLHDRYVWTKFGEDERWKKSRRVNQSTKRYTPIGFRYGKDFRYTGPNPEWKGKMFYREIIGVDGHSGIDFLSISGTCLYAPHDGEVIFVRGDNPTYGETICIVSDEIKGKRFVSLMTHLQDEYVKVGDRVKAGQLIGQCDNTGQFTTGPHLHWGIRELEPMRDGLKEYSLYKGWGYKNDSKRGYFNFEHLIEVIDIKQLPYDEGEFVWRTDTQNGAKGQIYEVKDGELKFLDSDKNPVTRHIPLVDRVLEIMNDGIEPDMLNTISENNFNEIKHLVK